MKPFFSKDTDFKLVSLKIGREIFKFNFLRNALWKKMLLFIFYLFYVEFHFRPFSGLSWFDYTWRIFKLNFFENEESYVMILAYFFFPS